MDKTFKTTFSDMGQQQDHDPRKKGHKEISPMTALVHCPGSNFQDAAQGGGICPKPRNLTELRKQNQS